MTTPTNQITAAPALSLQYAVKTPALPSENNSPLLILIHGYGSNEQDLLALAPYLDDRLMVVSPRAPYILQPGSYDWFGITFTPDGIEYSSEQALESLALLERFFDELLQTYRIDTGKVFIGGFSQGAVMSLSFALKQPKRLAGVLAMSSQFPIDVLPSEDKSIYQGLPIFVAHGIYDNVLSLAGGRNVRDQLGKLPVKLAYHEYDMAHEINAESLKDMTEWLTGLI